MRNFRKLTIWNDGRFLVKDIYTFTQKLPDSEKFGLISQINRCSISITANIAEGCAKNTDKDFGRFLQISLGSLYELESDITFCQDIEFSNQNISEPILEKTQKLQKQIASLINKL